MTSLHEIDPLVASLREQGCQQSLWHLQDDAVDQEQHALRKT